MTGAAAIRVATLWADPLGDGDVTARLEKLQRHDFVRVAAGDALHLSGPAQPDARPLLGRWVRAQLPLVVRRRAANDASGVCLGVSLPPAWGRLRLALTAPASGLLSITSPPTLEEVMDAAPAQWRETLQELQACCCRFGIIARVFGSLAWQKTTGLAYLTGHSDLDLLLPLPPSCHVLQMLDGIADIATRSTVRIDGEVVRPDGAAVNWLELQRRSAQVLVKSLQRVELQHPAHYLGSGGVSP